MERQNEWLFEAPFTSRANDYSRLKRQPSYLFELPFNLEADYNNSKPVNVAPHSVNQKASKRGKIESHHVHQSASNAPAPGAKDPNRQQAISVQLTPNEHRQASQVQRGLNQGLHGGTVNQTVGTGQGNVQVTASGDAKLPPAPSSTTEDLKALYSLMAARPDLSPDEAYRIVQQSSQQLTASKTVPRHVPRR